MDNQIIRLKEHLASHTKTIATLEKNSSLKDDIIANMRSTIADMEKQLAELEEQNALHVQITETQYRIIAELRGNIIARDEKFSVRDGGSGDVHVGEQRAHANSADRYTTTARDFQPFWRETATDASVSAETPDGPLKQPQDKHNHGASIVGQKDNTNTGMAAVLAGNASPKNTVLPPVAVASTAKKTEVEGGEGGKGKGKGLLGRWKSLRMSSTSSGPPFG
ncbi:hypothetical protein P171DRAFT_444131 [Karstenula rhodostoma CBS 690.94]|uniref:Uncharacterized protein n=1 Tax=Karstenula rhodostoma CBS 690.94 TaxID=1392251 RepID=A0A9P4PLC4_9PLEO|nr:hypothetical protein P171DRAFT_444131 [Karstenula rhodostoma CBS 690.94]